MISNIKSWANDGRIEGKQTKSYFRVSDCKPDNKTTRLYRLQINATDARLYKDITTSFASKSELVEQVDINESNDWIDEVYRWLEVYK